MSGKDLHKHRKDLLEHLLEDPTRSIRDIAIKMDSYRQKVYRDKKKLEDDEIIWGYTAVINENKLNHVMYLVMMKTKPMNKGLADLLIRRIVEEEPRKQRIRLIDLFFVNGEYDLILRFSAPDHAIARKYYDTLRLLYEDYLLEKPVIVDLNFCLVAEGKVNPNLRELYEFIPIT